MKCLTNNIKGIPMYHENVYQNYFYTLVILFNNRQTVNNDVTNITL